MAFQCPLLSRGGAASVFLVVVVFVTHLIIVTFWIYHYNHREGVNKENHHPISEPVLCEVPEPRRLQCRKDEHATSSNSSTVGNTTSFLCPPQTYSASYPGSGAELFRALVQAISGYTSTEVYHKKSDINDHYLIKTHEPMFQAFAIHPKIEPKQAIYLMRNPLWSLPSFFNHRYEERNKIKGHSVQAPEEEWIQWRNNSFEKEMQKWVEHLYTWTDKYNASVLFLVPYEDITGKDGSEWLYRVAQFLQHKTGVNMPTRQVIECLWEAVVKRGEGRASKRQAKTYTPQFTITQLDEMESKVQKLIQHFTNSTNPAVQSILNGYVQAIGERKRHVST